jgi:G:T-mismatch repair DNA endonuclease (very short patch repair protein)
MRSKNVGFSAEHRAKISKALLGNKNSLGHVLTAEHKVKLLNANLGGKRGSMSATHKTKISIAHTGKKQAPHSVETRAKLSAAAVRRIQKQPKSDTKPERAVRAKLESLHVEFQAQAVIDGDPYHVWDFAIPSQRVLIEVDGCYWHGCKRCGQKGMPGTHRHDKAKNTVAKKLGWHLIRIRECNLAL